MQPNVTTDAGRAALEAYLPRTLLEQWARSPNGPRIWHTPLYGSLMLCDMSGFTAMSERLARRGKEGAELMAGILNQFFSRMLGIADGWGGVQMKFGGDAMLLFFDGEGHEHRAAACALEMQRAMPEFKNVRAGGDVHSLRMRIGFHSGSFFSASAGDEDGVLHYLLLGADVNRTAAIEGEAKPGQVVASAQAAEALRVLGARLIATGGGCSRVIRIDEPARPLPRMDTSGAARDVLVRYVMPPIAAPLAAGNAPQFAAEHRRVTAVFVNVFGIAELLRERGDAEALAQVDAYLKIVLRNLEKHDGFLGGSDAAETGDKLIILFGAPISSERDEMSAIRFALDLRAEAASSGLALEHRIGISTGSVFAGEIGSPGRREYTVIGDTVNLAARLMSAASTSEIYVSEPTAERAQSEFELRSLPPLTLKGKSEPVPAFRLEGARESPASTQAALQRRIVGREEETARIIAVAERTRHSGGSWAFVSGEPGIGKSTLLAHVGDRLLESGWLRIRSTTQAQHSRTVLAAWVEPLRQLFRIQHGDSPDEGWQKLHATIKRLQPARAAFAPLVADLLSLPSEKEPMLEFLDAKRRRALLNATILGVIRGAARQQPLLFVFEDAHLSDAPSLELLADLLMKPASSCLIVLTSRNTTPPAEMSGAEPDLDMHLRHLSDESARLIAASVAGLDEAEIAAIVARAQGNPLFIEEMALNRTVSAGELPLTINEVILARLDRLPYAEKSVLRVAAIAGTTFDGAHVESLLSGDLAPGAALSAIARLSNIGFIVDHAEEDATHAFAHVLTQEVVYETMLYARRRELHFALATTIEGERAAQLGSASSVLLHHFERAGDAMKTVTYATMTAERAAGVFANREAMDYYARAISALERVSGNRDADRSVLLERIGDCLEMEGRHRAASEAFSDALAAWRARSGRRAVIVPRDTVLDRMRPASLYRRIAVSHERRSEYDEALKWLDEAEQLLPPRAGAIGSEVFASRSITLFRKGLYREAIESGRRAVSIARRTSDPRRIAYARNMLANSYLEEGSVKEAVRQLRLAIEIYERLGDVYGLAAANNNIGNCYQALGDLNAAVRHYEVALEANIRVGNDATIVHNNMGEVLLARGDVREAIIHLQEVVRANETDAELDAVAGLSHVNLSKSMLALGEPVAAAEHLAKGLRLLTNVGAHALLAEARLQSAELALHEGRTDDALVEAQTVLREANELDAKVLMVAAERVVGAVYIALKETERADTHLAAGIALARRIGADQEEGRSLLLLAELLAARGERRIAKAHLRRAMSIFARTGAAADLASAERIQQAITGGA